jgi:malonyl CoA-acyl carrier protein transacylase
MSELLSPIVNSPVVPAENIDVEHLKAAIQAIFETGGTFSFEVCRLKTDVRLIFDTGQGRYTSPLTEASEIIQSCSREAEIARLGAVGNEQAIYELCQILENDPDPEIRAAAATAIGTIAVGNTLTNADS